MLLAFTASDPERCIGGVALRCLVGHTPTLGAADSVAGVPLSQVCELKRLFVDPSQRGLNAGKALLQTVLQQARRLGYRLVVLDCLERLVAANRLYQRLGFVQCERYNDCPLPGVQYWSFNLDNGHEMLSLH
jgi:GNAT superfamily N-acetyltransferase